MKKQLLLIALAGQLAVLPSCSGPGDQKSGKETVKKKGRYVCTMDPSVSSDTPGVCPKCGMELVERDTTADK